MRKRRWLIITKNFAVSASIKMLMNMIPHVKSALIRFLMIGKILSVNSVSILKGEIRMNDQTAVKLTNLTVMVRLLTTEELLELRKIITKELSKRRKNK